MLNYYQEQINKYTRIRLDNLERSLGMNRITQDGEPSAGFKQWFDKSVKGPASKRDELIKRISKKHLN